MSRDTDQAPRPKRHPRTRAELIADPRVDEIWQEDDGCFPGYALSYWLALADGYNWEGCSCLHEPTIRELCNVLHRVETGDPY
jgi:hypothetical protein